MSELFARLDPPAGGRERLQRGLQRRARRRRRARTLVASVVAVGVVLTTWLFRPGPTPTVAAPAAIHFEPTAHPAIAVWDGAPPIGAELHGPGTLVPIATQATDVVLYVHDPG